MIAVEQASQVAAIYSGAVVLGLIPAASGSDASIYADESSGADDYIASGAKGVPRVARVESRIMGAKIFAEISPMSAKSSPSGGGRSGGSSSSIGGPSGSGGGGGDGPKKKEMSARAVLTALLALHLKREPSLLRWEFDYLREKKLIETINPYVYDCQERETQRIEDIEDCIEKDFVKYAGLDRQLLDLKRKQGSWWHIFWSWVFNLGPSGIKEEARRLEEVKKERAALTEEIQKNQADLKGLCRTKKYIDGFVSTDFGLVGLSDEGAQVLKMLREHENHDIRFPMSEFETRIAEFRAAGKRSRG